MVKMTDERIAELSKVIAPLEWTGRRDEDGEQFYTAATRFGHYKVEFRNAIGWRWGYCFDEYYDEEENTCEGLRDGKRLAWLDWLERLDGALLATQPGESK
jgi:hypothetical protein